jgi:hypothetical protein
VASLTNQLNEREREKLIKRLNQIRYDNDNDRSSIVAWLSVLLSKQDEKNRKTDGPELYRGQGKAILLSELIEIIEGSGNQLRKLTGHS